MAAGSSQISYKEKGIIVSSRIWGLELKPVPIWKWLCLVFLQICTVYRKNNQLILQGRYIMKLKGKLGEHYSPAIHHYLNKY
jgi:hypothetical protein